MCVDQQAGETGEAAASPARFSANVFLLKCIKYEFCKTLNPIMSKVRMGL